MTETEEESENKTEELFGPDKELEKLREKIEKSGPEVKEMASITGIEPYDFLKFGPLASFDGKEGFEEVDRYWVEKPFSFVSILRSKDTGELQYHLTEPQLSEEENEILGIIQEELRDRLPYEAPKEEEKEVMSEKFLEATEDYGITDLRVLYKLFYRLVRDNLGYGLIEAMLKDDMIEDISCDGANVPVFVYHRKHYNLKTNVKFEEDELNSFVARLAEKCEDRLSYAKPVVESTLPDGSRVQLTLGREVTTKGSSFTIRKFMGSTFTPIDLIKYGTFNAEMMANLWFAIENGKSVMVVGGTASGKTSTLNALAFFIPPDAKIVSIEDTRELSLYQENWLPNLTREAPGTEELDMHELVKLAMRQRPECLIVGEVRGVEALAMFQAMSTGHTCFSTMHAGSIQDAVNRLEGEPINTPAPMLAELDIMCIQLLTNLGKERVRRNRKIVEFVGLDPESEKLKIVETFSWTAGTDSFEQRASSSTISEIREDRGMSHIEVKKELENRKKVLQYMVDNQINSYGKVASFIHRYYFEPERVLEDLSSDS